MDALKIWLKNSVQKSNHPDLKGAECVDVEVESWGHGQVSVLSDISKVILKLNTSNGEKIIKALVKVESASEMGRHLAEDWQVFDSEIIMYNEILKTMEKLFLEAGEKDFPWPDCYYCADNKLLLQNLCEYGYDVVPMHKLLDFEHTMHVMEAIGKYHGITMIMEEQKLIDHSKLKPSFLSGKKPLIINLIKLNYGNIAKNIKETWGSEWASAADQLLRLAENPGESLYDEIEQAKGKWDVLNHGDFSIRNMLFHYTDGSTRPDAIKFIDFQVCHYNNLVFDLVNILYSSLQPQLRDENMDKFLNKYLESLNNICKAHSYKGSIPSLEEIKLNIRSIPYFSTMCSINSIGFFMSSKGKDSQKDVDELMKNIANKVINENDEIGVKKTEDVFNVKEIKDVLQYEIRRLVKEKIL